MIRKFYWEPRVFQNEKLFPAMVTKVPIEEAKKTPDQFYWDRGTAGGRSYEKAYITASRVSGEVVWVDIVKQVYEKQASLQAVVALLSQNKPHLHIVTVPMSRTRALSGISLESIGRHALTEISIEAWERKLDGKAVLKDNGQPEFGSAIKMVAQGFAPTFDVSGALENNYWDARQRAGAEPVVQTVGGTQVTDYTPELAWWARFVLKAQQRLFETGKAMPCAASSIFRADVAWTGWPNELKYDEGFAENVDAHYRSRVVGVVFKAFGSGPDIDASDALDAYFNPQPAAATPSATIVPTTVAGAVQVLPQDPFQGVMEPVAEPVGGVDDLPF